MPKEIGDTKATADTYRGLGDDFFSKKDFAKAEHYFKKAADIYDKLGDKKRAAETYNQLAKAQEKQKKSEDAVNSYKESNSRAGTGNNSQNEMNRLNAPNNDSKRKIIQSNIGTYQQQGNTEDEANAYQQMADLSVQENNIPDAIQNYESALKKAESPMQIEELQTKITDVYARSNQFDKAIEAQARIIANPVVEKNPQLKVEQMQNLANLYKTNQQDAEAMKVLRESYQLAMDKGQTLGARESAVAMAEMHVKNGNAGEAISLLKGFAQKLGDVISKDSSLVDMKMLLLTEERIRQLESERELKDKLISNTKKFNYFLMAAALLLLALAGFIFLAFLRIRRQKKSIELQSLQKEMNPHFLFNSLNSVNQFIAQNNELAANKYLSSYSQLMRTTMENSSKDFITLEKEMDLLQKYLDLEQMRFPNTFRFEIIANEDLNPNTLIPNMLVQPHIENAIWHGLRYKQEKGELHVRFEKAGEGVRISVKDNGIGIEQSLAQKTINQRQYESIGQSNTFKRISLLNQLYNKNIKCEVKDSPNGVEVLIWV